MHITSLINMAFNIIVMKNQNMLKVNQQEHVNKIGVIDSYQNYPPTKLSLKVMHLKYHHLARNASNIKEPLLSRQARADTYIK